MNCRSSKQLEHSKGSQLIKQIERIEAQLGCAPQRGADAILIQRYVVHTVTVLPSN